MAMAVLAFQNNLIEREIPLPPIAKTQMIAVKKSPVGSIQRSCPKEKNHDLAGRSCLLPNPWNTKTQIAYRIAVRGLLQNQ